MVITLDASVVQTLNSLKTNENQIIKRQCRYVGIGTSSLNLEIYSDTWSVVWPPVTRDCGKPWEHDLCWYTIKVWAFHMPVT